MLQAHPNLRGTEAASQLHTLPALSLPAAATAQCLRLKATSDLPLAFPVL